MRKFISLSGKYLRATMPIILICMLTASGIPSHVGATPGFGSPVLKWQLGGCYSSWCETGWYSSPATADLDGDGQVEVIASTYSIFVLDGSTGALEWQMSSGHDRSVPGAPNVGRTWPGIVLADIDNDGGIEIVTAHDGGWVSVYNASGYFEAGWPQHPSENELRGLSVSDLDGDNLLEVIVTGAVYNEVNTWVFEPNGALRAGWPQLSNDSGYAYGVFNANASAGDLDGDNAGEVIVPSDVHYICAYEADGTQIPANALYGGKGWGKVGIWESLAIELRGWGECNGVREESYRTNFAHGPSVIADMNGDGLMEVVVTGNVYDCNVGHPPGKYNGVYVFNADRSRFNADGFDWQSVPVDTGAPLTEDYGVIENNQPNPAVADLDGDGQLEIIYASYDGRVHAFWLDKTEHGNWPYSVYNPTEGFYRFASEPVIADLDNNDYAEVIFTSWTQKGSYQTGRLHILDYLGNPIYEVSLPDSFGEDWNGALPAPTLANIDSDPDLELVLLTSSSGVVVYDLPGTANAYIQWGTGRGDYQRDGYRPNALQPTLRDSTKASNRPGANPGDLLIYTITLHNSAGTLNNASMTDPLPVELVYAGNLWASSGTASYSGGTVSWFGAVSFSANVVIRFDASVDAGIISPMVIINTATISDGVGHSWQREAAVTVFGIPLFLPLVRR